MTFIVNRYINDLSHRVMPQPYKQSYKSCIMFINICNL